LGAPPERVDGASDLGRPWPLRAIAPLIAIAVVAEIAVAGWMSAGDGAPAPGSLLAAAAAPVADPIAAAPRPAAAIAVREPEPLVATSRPAAATAEPGPPVGWIHPLAGVRQLPIRDARRFGAARPGVRPAECGGGHCGVDIGGVLGSPVHAAAGGRVAAVVHDPNRRAGRFVAIDHPGGLKTFYMHLHTIRADLEVGRRLGPGEPIGTLGRSGILRSRPHLHFSIARRAFGRTFYVDPEPVLRQAPVLPVPGYPWREPAPVEMALATDDLAAEIAATSGGAAIRAEVRDALSRVWLPGVAIDARGPGGARATARTDGTGLASLRGLVPGRWELRVHAGGYGRVRRVVELGGGGDHLASVELTRGATLAGVVRDRDGVRVAGARVRAARVSTTTDADGRFRLVDAPTGAIDLVAEGDEGEGALALDLVPGDELVTLELRIE
jgi:murein DD-endopeptidase MepM/ murein hydrolase activator NlpD